MYHISHVLVGGSILESKKVPSKLNKQQKSILEGFFTHLRYADEITLKELALQTGLREEQVARWFRNKRHSAKKGKCKGTLSFKMYIYFINRSTIAIRVMRKILACNLSVNNTYLEKHL